MARASQAHDVKADGARGSVASGSVAVAFGIFVISFRPVLPFAVRFIPRVYMSVKWSVLAEIPVSLVASESASTS